MSYDDKIFGAPSPPMITGIENPFGTILESAKEYLQRDDLFDKSREGLELCIDIVEVQERLWGEYAVKSELDPEVLLLRVRGGVPALEKEIKDQVGEQFIDIFREIQAAVGLDKKLIDDSISIIFDGQKVKHSDKETTIMYTVGALLENRTDREMSLTIVSFDAASQVFAVSLAESVRPVLEMEPWHHESCPVCGGHFEMGRIEPNDGHNYLGCAVCFTEWKYPRLKCPSCGNDIPTELGHFTAEEYPGYRVNFCNKCRTYYKSSVEKLLKRRHIPLVDTLLSLEMDIAARSEGFTPPQ